MKNKKSGQIIYLAFGILLTTGLILTGNAERLPIGMFFGGIIVGQSISSFINHK